MFSIFRLALTAFLLLAPSLSRADLPRPLDPSHTRRLVAEALADRLPDAVITADLRGANSRIALPDGRALRLETDELHQLLRAEADGRKREEILTTYLSQLLGKPVQDATPAGKNQPRAAGSWKSAPKAGATPEIGKSVPQPVVETPPAAAAVPEQEPQNLRQQLQTYGVRVHLSRAYETRNIGFPALQPFQTAMGIVEIRAWVLYGQDASVAMKRSGFDKGLLMARWLAALDAPSHLYQETLLPGTRIRKLTGANSPLLMLSSKYWSAALREGRVILAAVPTDDTLLWIDAPEPAEVEKLSGVANALYRRRYMDMRSPGLKKPEADALSEELAILTGMTTWMEPGWSGPQIWQTPKWERFKPEAPEPEPASAP